MRTKAEDVQVDNPAEAMRKFQSALSKVVRAPKTQFKAKRKSLRTVGKKRPKR